MSLIYSNNTAGLQSQAVVKWQVMLNSEFQQIVNMFNANKQFLWSNPLGLTPAQVLAALGSNAGELMTLGIELSGFLNSIQPGVVDVFTVNGSDVQVNGHDLTMNADGSVTINS
jgi:hypothetical protein